MPGDVRGRGGGRGGLGGRGNPVGRSPGWGPVGLYALGGTLAAAAFAPLHGQVYENSIAIPAACAALAALGLRLLSLAVTAAFVGPVAVGWFAVGHVLATTLTTALAAAPLYALYWRLIPPRRA